MKFKIFQKINVDQVKKHDKLREHDCVTFYSSYYLQRCWDESEVENKADVTIYKQLIEIDAKLGLTQSEQLFSCVFYSLRMDLIKV